MTLYTTIALAIVVLCNLPALRKLQFHAATTSNAPAVDPSGYSKITTITTEEANKKKDSSFSSVFDFFGFPALLLCAGVWYANRKAGRHIGLIKAVIFFGVSFFIYEVLAYTMMIGSVVTFGFGTFILPVLAAVNMGLFLLLSRIIFQWKKNPALVWSAVGASLVAGALPVWYFFVTTDTSNLFSLSVILWQVVAIVALSRFWKLNVIEAEPIVA